MPNTCRVRRQYERVLSVFEEGEAICCHCGPGVSPEVKRNPCCDLRTRRFRDILDTGAQQSRHVRYGVGYTRLCIRKKGRKTGQIRESEQRQIYYFPAARVAAVPILSLVRPVRSSLVMLFAVRNNETTAYTLARNVQSEYAQQVRGGTHITHRGGVATLRCYQPCASGVTLYRVSRTPFNHQSISLHVSSFHPHMQDYDRISRYFPLQKGESAPNAARNGTWRALV